MKKMMICVLMSVFVSSAFASTTVSEEDKRDLLKRSYQAAMVFSASYQIFNEISNLLSLPSLEEGSQIYFGTLVTLKGFDCKTTATDTQVCKATSLYCISQNEFPPAYNTLTITTSEDLQTIRQLDWTTENATGVTCQ